MTPTAKNIKAWISQITPQTRDGQHPQISAKAEASEVLTFRAMVSSMTSHRQYKHDMTPMKRMKYLNATPPPTNQKSRTRPDIPKIKTHVIQFLLAHQSVKRKNTASTIDAILLALVLNPHAIKHAPMNEDPRYPAGRVNHGIPPDIAVEPPSSGSNSIEWMRAQVRTPMKAWLISWNPTVRSLNGYKISFKYGTCHRIAMAIMYIPAMIRVFLCVTLGVILVWKSRMNSWPG